MDEIQFEFVETPLGPYLINEHDLIGNFIKQQLFWEPHLINYYSNIIESTDVVIDAGANLGYHTVQFAKLAKTVYAFEPQKMIFNQMCTNLLFNGVSDNVYTYRYGLGEKFETKQLCSAEEHDFKNGIINFGGRGIKDEPIDNNRWFDIIEIIPLDSLQIDVCNLIKMDIQGYEFYALTGAMKLITKNYPVMLMENSGQELDKKAIKILSDLGYECYRYMIGTAEDCILIHKNNEKKYNTSIGLITKLSEMYKIQRDF